MERIFRIEQLAWLGLWTLAACEPGVVVPASDTDGSTGIVDGPASSSSSSSSPVPEPAESSDSGPSLLCVAGTQRCGDDGALETCAPGGGVWESMTCPEGTQCVPCDGDGCNTASCLGPCDDGGPSSSQGCSFLVARQLGLSEVLGPDLDIPEEDWPRDGLLLLNPSETELANVDVYELAAGETEPGDVSQSIVLPPGSAELVPVGNPLPLGWTSTVRIGSMAWVDSDQPIVAYAYSPLEPFVGNDSSMLLPETSLGRHYIVPSYPPHYLQFQGAGTPTYFDVLATAPNTTVRWRSEFAPTFGPGVPNELVEPGEWSEAQTVSRFTGVRVVTSFSVEDPHDADVSGVVVEASEPVYVIGGSRCSAVPELASPDRGCDPLTEALIPLEQWGSTYAVPAPPPRMGEQHHYRIYGGDGGVTMTTDPPGLAADDYTFGSRGDFVDVVVPFETNFSVTADGPIMVVGYLASRDLAGDIGDPAMYQHVPLEQGATRYVIGAPAKWDTQFVQVVRSVGAADVELDGAALVNWQPVGAEYEVATAELEPGVHALDSADAFVANQFAYNNSEQNACEGYAIPPNCHSSYAHPVGMRTQRLYEP